MPSAVSQDVGTGPSDDLDNLVDNYDQAVNDFLRDLPIERNKDGNATLAPEKQVKDVDEEIKVRKARRPNPKLDEGRLLSDAGIPKLQRIAKTKLKFKGKGHEFNDIERLLNTYQLWLDDLYPRAKFRDALTMMEKVGHSKRMQMTRRGWMDGTKPDRQEQLDTVGDEEDVVRSGALGDTGERQDKDQDGDLLGTEVARPQDTAIASKDTTQEDEDDVPEEDELDALMAENEDQAPVEQQKPSKRRGPFEEDEHDDSDEDELDALLSEQPKGTSGLPEGLDNASKQLTQPEHQHSFEDEEEVMASLGGMW